MLGNKDESIALCNELLQKPASWIRDQMTLQYVTATLQNMDRYDLVEKMYKDAFETYKNDSSVNISMAHTLFGAYVRSNNYTQQRLTATELWKMTKDDKYWIWCAIATSRQVQVEGESPILNLAAAMIDAQYIKKGKAPTQQIIEVLINIYKQMHKYDEALGVATSEEAMKTFKVEFERQNEEVKILHLKKEYEKAATLYQKLLQQNPDEWSWYKGFIECSHHLGKKQEELLPFILEKQQQSSVKLRSPFLAEVELDRYYNGEKISVEPILKYFNTFAHKGSLFYDLIAFIKVLSVEKRKILLDSIVKEISFTDLDDKDKVNKVIEATNIEFFVRALTAEKEPKTITDKINSLIGKYESAKQLKITREESEKRAEDDFLLLAAYYLIDLSTIEQNTSRTLQAISLLEYGLSFSPHNFQFRLILIHLYGSINAVYGSTLHVDALNIKNIQLDTVSYIFLDSYIQNAYFKDAVKIFAKSLRLYLENRSSSSGSIVDAYRHGSYTQISEAEKLRDRLEHSIQHVVVRLENFIVQLFQENSQHLKTFFSTTYSHLSLPDSLEKIEKLYVNYDKDFISTFDLEGLELYATNGKYGRTTTFADEQQKHRILFYSIALRYLSNVCNLDATSVDIATLKQDLDLITTTFNDFEAKLTDLERKQCQIIINMLTAFYSVASVFKSFHAGVVDPDYQSSDAAYKSVSESIVSITEIISQSELPLSSSEGSIIGLFLARTLVFVHFIVTTGSKLLKLKTTPKTPEDIKKELTSNKSGLQSVKDSLLKSYETIQSKITHQRNTSDIPIVGLANTLEKLVNDDEWNKSTQKLSENIKKSINDTSSVLLTIIKDKIKELKSI